MLGRHLLLPILATALLLGGRGPTVRGAELAAWAKAHLDELVELYRHFHAHPELSFEERETAARVAKELRASAWR